MNTVNDIYNALLGESILFFGIILLFVFYFTNKRMMLRFSKHVASIILFLSGLSVIFVQIMPDYYALNGNYISNSFTAFFKIILSFSAILILVGMPHLPGKNIRTILKYYILFLLGITLSYLIISCDNFLFAFILLGIYSFIDILLIKSESYQNRENITKKFIKGEIISSVIFLAGTIILYLNTGTLTFGEIQNDKTEYGILYILSGIMILSALIYKLGCNPLFKGRFEALTESGYQYSKYGSCIPLISFSALITRIIVYIFEQTQFVSGFCISVAIITAVISGVLLIKTDNIKKLTSYIYVMHLSFILILFACKNVYSLSAGIFYLLGFVIANIGFQTALSLYNSGYLIKDTEDFKGVLIKSPLFGAGMIICLSALIGAPLTGGFIADICTYSSFIKAGIPVIFAIIIFALCYCVLYFVMFKFLNVMIQTPDNNVSVMKKRKNMYVIIYICAIISVLLFFIPDSVIKIIEIITYYI